MFRHVPRQVPLRRAQGHIQGGGHPRLPSPRAEAGAYNVIPLVGCGNEALRLLSTAVRRTFTARCRVADSATKRRHRPYTRSAEPAFSFDGVGVGGVGGGGVLRSGTMTAGRHGGVWAPNTKSWFRRRATCATSSTARRDREREQVQGRASEVER